MNTYRIEALITKNPANPKFKVYFVEDCDSSLEAIMKYFEGCPFAKNVEILKVYPIY
jgi:hypothetical protein